jgi:hypothetical protein
MEGGKDREAFRKKGVNGGEKGECVQRGCLAARDIKKGATLL